MDQSTTIIGSIFAGVVSTILGHPLDTVKTHLQTNPNYHNSCHVVQTIRLDVFRGIMPPLFNAIVMNSVMFSVFDAVMQNTSTTRENPFAAGLISGFATAMISTPTDYVKIRAQLDDGKPPTTTNINRRRTMINLRDRATAGRWRMIPVQQLYRGHTANLAREGIFTMVYLGVYHWALSSSSSIADGEFWAKKNWWTVAATSSLTGGLAWVVSYPCDTVKTMRQNGSSWGDIQRMIYQKGSPQGWRALYRGCGTSTGRAMLVTSSRMVVYEWVVGILLVEEQEG